MRSQGPRGPDTRLLSLRPQTGIGSGATEPRSRSPCCKSTLVPFPHPRRPRRFSADPPSPRLWSSLFDLPPRTVAGLVTVPGTVTGNSLRSTKYEVRTSRRVLKTIVYKVPGGDTGVRVKLGALRFDSSTTRSGRLEETTRQRSKSHLLPGMPVDRLMVPVRSTHNHSDRRRRVGRSSSLPQKEMAEPFIQRVATHPIKISPRSHLVLRPAETPSRICWPMSEVAYSVDFPIPQNGDHGHATAPDSRAFPSSSESSRVMMHGAINGTRCLGNHEQAATSWPAGTKEASDEAWLPPTLVCWVLAKLAKSGGPCKPAAPGKVQFNRYQKTSRLRTVSYSYG